MLQRRHSALSSHQDSNSTTSTSAAAAANATIAGDAYRHDDNCNNVSILSNTSSDEDEDDLGTVTGHHRHRQLAFAASDTDEDDDDDAFELRLSNYHKKSTSYPSSTTTYTTTTTPIFSYSSERFGAEKENNQCPKAIVDAEDNSDVDVDDYSDDSSSNDRTKLLLLSDSKLNEPRGELDDGSHRKENGPTGDKPTRVKQEPPSPSRDPDKSFDPLRHLLTSEASKPYQSRLVNDATAFFRQLERHPFSFPSTFPFYPFFPPPSLLFSAQSNRPFSQLPTGVATSPPPHIPSTPSLPGQGKEPVVPDLPTSSSVQHFSATAQQMMFYHQQQQQQRHLFQQHRHNILSYQNDRLGIQSDGFSNDLAVKSSGDVPRFADDKFNSNAELKTRDNFFKSHRYSQLFHQALRTKDQTFDDLKSGILKKSSLSFLPPGKIESEADIESGFSAQTDKGRINGSESKASEETPKNHESSLVSGAFSSHTSTPYFRTNSSVTNSRSHRNVSPPTSNRASKSSTPPRKTSSILQA